ncbi:MAG TPA: hypothetical protein VN889_05880 [Solirubrobacteraceae bacterium]|nr:hypothetical protein [Solirubrobacteraceae bacterium]
MRDAAPARLGELVASARTLALVGLAKNTGKTVTLRAILAEHATAGRTVGVTSIGRDGERHDVIDARIEKPSVELQAGDLVASTGALLRASGVEHERLEQTGVRTPLGEVVLARLLQPGAIDRRAASSPAVADALVMATGAILAEQLDEVVARTSDAVDLVKLSRAELDGEHVTVARALVLNAQPEQIAALLRTHPRASAFVVDGALDERFLDGLLAARGERAGRELRIVAADPTHVFLSRRGPRWYARQGIAIEVLRTIELKAITVNPIAPQSHSFDSRELRESIESAVSDVPVLDVLDASYLALAK